jgi:hypothetical protein
MKYKMQSITMAYTKVDGGDVDDDDGRVKETGRRWFSCTTESIQNYSSHRETEMRATFILIFSPINLLLPCHSKLQQWTETEESNSSKKTMNEWHTVP